ITAEVYSSPGNREACSTQLLIPPNTPLVFSGSRQTKRSQWAHTPIQGWKNATFKVRYFVCAYHTVRGVQWSANFFSLASLDGTVADK
uniref:Uncharacterized protein n=1 Tax=Salarias fasciatus TaxID=181472 RepID=A0A672IXD7_SALFA